MKLRVWVMGFASFACLNESKSRPVLKQHSCGSSSARWTREMKIGAAVSNPFAMRVRVEIGRRWVRSWRSAHLAFPLRWRWTQTSENCRIFHLLMQRAVFGFWGRVKRSRLFYIDICLGHGQSKQTNPTTSYYFLYGICENFYRGVEQPGSSLGS